MMFTRIFDLPKTKSFFLFGARGTGKSTLLRTLFKDQQVYWIDLLNLDMEGRYSIRPMLLEEELKAADPLKTSWVVIDEIQKVPALLDVVHRLIENRRFRFALTGSSARKLKRGSANLLAGRALQKFLFPLTHVELANQFDLDFVLKWGSLPEVFQLDQEEREDYLTTYTNTYLKEEVQAEQLIRKIPPFRKFLDIAGQSSGNIINFSKIARDIGSDPVSVKSYFEILEDTLLGFTLPAFERSIRKQQSQSPKFYLFDLGVKHTLSHLLKMPLLPGTYEYGNAFEAFIITEIYRLNSYYKKDWSLSYLRTKEHLEIDLLIERPGQPLALIEIKSSRQVGPDDVRSLARIGRDLKNAQSLCLSLDPIAKEINKVHCYHWEEGFRYLGLM